MLWGAKYVSTPRRQATKSGPSDRRAVGRRLRRDLGIIPRTALATDVYSRVFAFIPGNEPPSITSDGGDTTAAVSVAENTTAVTTVIATDPDAEQALSYSIVGGADETRFTINSTTGALAFVTPPTSRRRPMRALTTSTT